MGLKFSRFIDLPENEGEGGFDHAAVHASSRKLYVAHTANNALDVIDCIAESYLHSILNLAGVAGALVSDERKLVFTSNRGENTVGIFSLKNEAGLVKISVGVRPNGLSLDPGRGLLLAANVGSPDKPDSFTLSIVDIQKKEMIASIPVPGRTRWTIFDATSDEFFVNISEPAQIVVVQPSQPDRISRVLEIPSAGPHGLDLDDSTGRLFCACDSGKLFAVKTATGKITAVTDLSGKPDVIFFNPTLKHLYVAVGDPGLIDVFETDGFQKLETVPTEIGAHTLAFEAGHNKVYAFLPQSHRAAVYLDQ